MPEPAAQGQVKASVHFGRARQAAEATRQMLAKRGRAAYTGERSIGTLDAGAIAMAVLFEAVSKAWKE